MKLRQKLLLDEILQDGMISITRLSEDFAVSAKTVRNDIDEINSYLAERTGKPCLQVESGNVIFCGGEASRPDCSVPLDDYYLYKLSSEERVLMILVELATAGDIVTIAALSQKLCVSRGTINADLLLVKEWCLRNQAKLSSRKGKGIRLEESSERRREILAAMIQEYCAISGIRGISDGSVQLYHSLFRGINMSELRDILLQAENQFAFVLSDEAYEELVIHLALCVKQGRAFPPDKVLEGGRFPANRAEYLMAEHITASVSDRFDVVLTGSATDYIASHIRGACFLAQTPDEDPKLPYIQLAAEQLIHAVGKELSFDFCMDPKLYDGLIQHLCAAISRVRNGITVQNPMFKTLIEEYRELYEAIRHNAQYLKATAQASFSDDELSYLLIYFATAMERELHQNRTTRPPAVAVLCATGEGTAKLVLESLRKHYRLDMHCIIALHQLEQVQREERLDFIISAVPINTQLPCVYVNPVIRREDLERLDRMILSLGFPGSFCSSGGMGTGAALSPLAARVAALAEELGSPDQEQTLRGNLEVILRESEKKENLIFERNVQPMLSQLLKTEYITLDAPASDWQEAIRVGSEGLLRNGVVDGSYVDAAIQNVKELGPYIVLTKGVAIPHASREFGVHQTAISLARLETPVPFGSVENDPVRFVFTLATVDASSHLQALRDLVSLFDDPEFFATLAHAQCPEEITAFILGYEETKGGMDT